jgi:hypothetical protein
MSIVKVIACWMLMCATACRGTSGWVVIGACHAGCDGRWSPVIAHQKQSGRGTASGYETVGRWETLGARQYLATEYLGVSWRGGVECCLFAAMERDRFTQWLARGCLEPSVQRDLLTGDIAGEDVALAAVASSLERGVKGRIVWRGSDYFVARYVGEGPGSMLADYTSGQCSAWSTTQPSRLVRDRRVRADGDCIGDVVEVIGPWVIARFRQPRGVVEDIVDLSASVEGVPALRETVKLSSRLNAASTELSVTFWFLLDVLRWREAQVAEVVVHAEDDVIVGKLRVVVTESCRDLGEQIAARVTARAPGSRRLQVSVSLAGGR